MGARSPSPYPCSQPHPQAKLIKDPETSPAAAELLSVLAAHPPTAKAIIATDGVLQGLVAKLQPGEGLFMPALAVLSWHDETRAAVASVPQCVEMLVGAASKPVRSGDTVLACMALPQLPGARAQMQPFLPPGTDDPREWWCKVAMGLR